MMPTIINERIDSLGHDVGWAVNASNN
jgi:hypothetical protein